MRRGFLKAGWRRLRDGIPALVGLQRQGSYLLLFRLENTELLERRLKAAGYAHLLAVLSARISAALHDGCQVAAVPQGRFAVVLADMPQAEAMDAARHLQQQAEQRLTVSDQSVTPVLSAVLLPRPVKSSSDADMISYGCKLLDQLDSDRMGQISLIPGISANASSRGNGAQKDPHESIEKFTTLFQPLICCYSERVCGFDMHAVTSRKAATDVMSNLRSHENTEHAVPFQPILRRAMSALRHWDKVDADIPRVSIFVPDCELQRPEFADWMQIEMTRMKMPPSRLALRISGNETAAMPSQIFQANIRKLRKIGCRVELCGFGIGPAGLEALRMIEVDSIRIDRRFVFCCDMDQNQQRTISAILAMAEQMEVGSVAEGVESPEEQVYLAQLGCQAVQGCAIAPPMSLEDTLDFTAARRGGATSRRDFTSRQIG